MCFFVTPRLGLVSMTTNLYPHFSYVLPCDPALKHPELPHIYKGLVARGKQISLSIHQAKGPRRTRSSTMAVFVYSCKIFVGSVLPPTGLGWRKCTTNRSSRGLIDVSASWQPVTLGAGGTHLARHRHSGAGQWAFVDDRSLKRHAADTSKPRKL